jgi:large subunit ribosomal protein L35
MIVKKQKTHRGAKKRFKVTGSGKLMRRRSHARHILTKKPRKRLRKLASAAAVSQSDARRVKAMLSM